MHIKFKEVIIHNFLSYGHAELKLEDKGYCLVEGINRCPKDKALSNGSGKSSWNSAICWALTGETIQGYKSDIKNINIDEKSCYVKLIFDADTDHYEITRYNEPKSDLKIIINGKDESGKGIRESETILASRLPDLDRKLLSSVVILGQGLPNKFSNNTAAGRKDVLEQLSKSDFMIQDIKDRISSRAIELNNIFNDITNKISQDNGRKDIFELKIKEAENKIAELEKIIDFDSKIKILEEQISKEDIYQRKLDEDIKSNNDTLYLIQENNQKTLVAKNEIINKINADKNEIYKKYLSDKSALDFKTKVLNDKITQVKNIKDVCPTCGRPFENVVKPSIEKEEAEVIVITEQLEKLKAEYDAEVEKFNKQQKAAEAAYKIKSDESYSQETVIKKELAELHSKPKLDLVSLRTELATTIANKTNHDKNLAEAKKDLEANKQELNKVLKSLEEKIKDSQNTQKHIEVIRKFETIVKRDFRGFLLSNIIKYIDTRCKYYASSIFGTNELDFTLDGNNISITYCKKNFDGLSGGEKQKVDLIIQFAIRDMMAQYLNFSSNILVLDEIFDNLDSLSSTNLINLISSNFNDIESVFIISHHSDELSIPADCVMTIEKNIDGISSIRA